MIYDLWFMIYDVWCMMYDVWCMMYDLWCIIYDLWFMITTYCVCIYDEFTILTKWLLLRNVIAHANAGRMKRFTQQ
jgi:hypothetical protein